MTHPNVPLIFDHTYKADNRTYDVTLRRVRENIFAVTKAISITYSECVFVDLSVQHAKRMRHLVMCLAQRPYNIFSTSSNKRHDFWKKEKVIEYKM